MLGIIVHVLGKPEKELETDDCKNKYGCFYDSHYLGGFPRYTIVMEVLRKFLVISLVVAFTDSVWKQCAAILAGSGIVLFWHIMFMPKKSYFSQFSAIASEVGGMLTAFGFISLSSAVPVEELKFRMNYLLCAYIATPAVSLFSGIAEQAYNLFKKICGSSTAEKNSSTPAPAGTITNSSNATISNITHPN